VDGVAECMFEMLPRVLGWPLVGCQRLFLAGPYGGGRHEAMVIRSDNGTLEPSLPHLSLEKKQRNRKQKTEVEIWKWNRICQFSATEEVEIGIRIRGG